MESWVLDIVTEQFHCRCLFLDPRDQTQGLQISAIDFLHVALFSRVTHTEMSFSLQMGIFLLIGIALLGILAVHPPF